MIYIKYMSDCPHFCNGVCAAFYHLGIRVYRALALAVIPTFVIICLCMYHGCPSLKDNSDKLVAGPCGDVQNL